MQRDVQAQKVEVLEAEQEMLKGSLFQASLPVVGTLIGLGIARWRLKVHKRRLDELQAIESPDAQVINQEALRERLGIEPPEPNGADGSPDAA